MGTPRPERVMGVAPPAPGYLFCFWNVENLFDDVDDGRGGIDREFANRPDLLKLKLENLTGVIRRMNGGVGPDVLGVCEMESLRAVEMLRDSLNAGMGEELRYRVAWTGAGRGRRVGVAVLSRLPLGKAVRVHPSLRILRVPVTVEGKTLQLVVSHWTSQLPEPSDPDGAMGRKKYARAVREDFEAVGGEYVAGGDFNEPPGEQLTPMWSPFAALAERGEASYWHNRWQMLDQVWLAPAMQDEKGWEYEEDSARVEKDMADGKGRPLRFGPAGARGPRGASDHFPVTVRLRVISEPPGR